MSLSAGRVGVRADQVDSHGRVNSPSFFNEIMEDLPVWTDLPVRVNGTEEVLPSNTSVPVTSPILTDIDYPDIRRNDQYFTYRESPTTVDGLAKIKSIKGNTLVWNQQYEDRHTGTAASEAGITRTYGNENIFILNGTSTGTATFYVNSTAFPRTFYKGHKYLFGFLLLQAENNKVKMGFTRTSTDIYSGYQFVTPTADISTNGALRVEISSGATLSNYSARILIFDLTKMFGAGNEPATVKEFTDLFPLSYYKYNAGSLLDFTGTKIKTVGENHLTNDSTKWGNYGTEASGYTSNNTRLAPKDYVIPFKAGGTYTFSYVDNGALPSGDYFYIGVNGYANGSRVFDSTWKTMPYSCTIPSNVDTLLLTYKRSNASWSCTDLVNEIGNRLFFSMVETDSINETELPIETYFPTGMKSAGTVYDELLPTKAITRIGAVDLGTLNWIYDSANTRFYTLSLSGTIKKGTSGWLTNLKCAKYMATSGVNEDKTMSEYATTGYVYIRDLSYSDSGAFKSAVNGVYLYYELATPVELPTLSFE